MHRKHLLELLEDYAPRHLDEAACVDRFIAFVRGHADCFKRSLTIGHVTGSAWVVNAAGDQVLLNHHRKLDKWMQFGGHADGHHDIYDVALREAMEETGLSDFEPVSDAIFDLDIHTIPARGNDPAHDHFDVRFALRVTGSHDFAISDESHDIAWVPLQRLTDYTQEPSMLRMRRKWEAMR